MRIFIIIFKSPNNLSSEDNDKMNCGTLPCLRLYRKPGVRTERRRRQGLEEEILESGYGEKEKGFVPSVPARTQRRER